MKHDIAHSERESTNNELGEDQVGIASWFQEMLLIKMLNLFLIYFLAFHD